MKDKLENLIKDVSSSKFYWREISSAKGRKKNRFNHVEEVFEYLNNFALLHNTIKANEPIYCVMNDIIPPKCKCGKNRKFYTYELGYYLYCGSLCENKWKDHGQKISEVWKNSEKVEQMVNTIKTNNVEKYGYENVMQVPEILQRYKDNNQKKYGYDFPLQSPDVQQSIKDIHLENLGVEYPFQSKEILEKCNQSFFENHGYENKMQIPRKAFSDANNGLNPFQLKSVQKSRENTMIDKYGTSHALQNLVLLEKSRNTLRKNYGRDNPAQLHFSDDAYEILQNKDKFENLLLTYPISQISSNYNINTSLIIARHKLYNLSILPETIKSRYEVEIAHALDLLGIEYIQNDRKICSPKEIDFYIPKHNLAIEFNGLYWHSKRDGNDKDEKYHAAKMLRCKDLGIQLLSIFEDEWVDNSALIVQKIKHLCGLTNNVIGARKIQVNATKDCNSVIDFLSENHLQGKVSGTTYSFTGTYNGSIVAVMTMKKINSDTYEMTRYCTNLKSSYPGLMSKFIKCFVKTVKDTTNVKNVSIITFADLRWSTGDVYYKTGFTKEYDIKPDYFYTDFQSRVHKSTCRKDRLQKTYGIDIEGKTEAQITKELKLERIYDCGKIKFKKIINIE